MRGASALELKMTAETIRLIPGADDGGDSWGNCWLGVEQGDSLWQFKINQNGIYSDTFELVLNSNDEVYFYYFEI